MRYILAIWVVLTASPLFAQLPNTKVYLFDYSRRDTTFTFNNPRYLTAFNERGFNNQPQFVDRSTLLMAVQLPDMPQPDVFSFDLSNQTRTRVTRTISGEFSPKPIGASDRFSAVRQEFVGRDTILRLWEFPLDRSTNGKPVFKYLTGIGYYEWINQRQLALFLLGEPNQLALASPDSDQPQGIARNVGRTFSRLPNGNLLYVQKAPTGPWYIMQKNLYRLTDEPTIFAETIPRQEDFVILSDGSVLMGQGSKIFHYDRIRSPRWREVVDLRFYGIRNITRLAVDGAGQIAIVSE
ncbi:MAG: hypothetical protein AAGF87_04305 [Bacteroidota bacterium]